jgi:hypothetical protein
VQGLAFEAGAQLALPRLNKTDLYDPITFGGGINLTATDPFNLKVRFGFSVGGTKEEKGEIVDNGMTGFSVGLLPSYKLAKMTIFFHAGLGIEAPTEGDAKYEWFINPYIWVPMGGMRMWVGLQIIDEHGARPDDVGQFRWNIPFGFNFYF